ncbi:hypothetical protein L6274_00970 [Candidatus Parcubacteria bacterium]|nr:hypothetical protein [Candidatus Parcubacteria bacterium]
MTLHIKKPNFKCSQCGAIFVPYKKGIKCPKCGIEIKEDISEHLNFIDMLAGSMKVHKMQFGRYFPGAWYVGSMSDHIQSLIFQTFDSMECDSEHGKEKEYLSNLINKMKCENDREYFKNYLKEIAFKVFDIYEKENFASIKKIIPSRSERIRKWFRDFMP